jgi:hypothetical protein
MPVLRLDGSDIPAATPTRKHQLRTKAAGAAGGRGCHSLQRFNLHKRRAPPTGQTATTPPSCCSPLSAAGRTPPSSARCLQTRAATPRANPYLLKCLASPNLTHQQSAARLFSRAWINRLPSGVNWLFTAAGGDDARPYQSGTGHRRQRFYVSRVRSKVRYWMASRT